MIRRCIQILALLAAGALLAACATITRLAYSNAATAYQINLNGGQHVDFTTDAIAAARNVTIQGRLLMLDSSAGKYKTSGFLLQKP